MTLQDANQGNGGVGEEPEEEEEVHLEIYFCSFLFVSGKSPTMATI